MKDWMADQEEQMDGQFQDQPVRRTMTSEERYTLRRIVDRWSDPCGWTGLEPDAAPCGGRASYSLYAAGRGRILCAAHARETIDFILTNLEGSLRSLERQAEETQKEVEQVQSRQRRLNELRKQVEDARPAQN